MSALLEKKATFTVNLLLDAACELTQTLDVSELSFKKVSERAEISQRTMFRYFRTRDAFLDALTARLYGELDLPDIPESVDSLADYIAKMYQKLDAQPRTVMVLLSADLLHRIINTSAKARFEALQQLLTIAYPSVAKSEIIKTAANLRYVMSASSWRYYRMHFNFDLTTSIECAQMLVCQSIAHLDS